MKRSLSLLMLTATLAFSQAGVMGGSEGLHQLNANTLGQWRVNAGAGGNFAVGSWALSRGGVFEAENRWKRYEGRSFNDMDFSHSSNLFVAVGVLDFVDVGASLPFYYDYAKSDKVGVPGTCGVPVSATWTCLPRWGSRLPRRVFYVRLSCLTHTCPRGLIAPAFARAMPGT